jgi:hypothetical protein
MDRRLCRIALAADGLAGSDAARLKELDPSKAPWAANIMSIISSWRIRRCQI